MEIEIDKHGIVSSHYPEEGYHIRWFNSYEQAKEEYEGYNRKRNYAIINHDLEIIDGSITLIYYDTRTLKSGDNLDSDKARKKREKK
jgi:hypothetical protein